MTGGITLQLEQKEVSIMVRCKRDRFFFLWKLKKYIFCHPHKFFYTAILDFLYMINIVYTFIFLLKYSFSYYDCFLLFQTWLFQYIRHSLQCMSILCVCVFSVLILLISIIPGLRDKINVQFSYHCHFQSLYSQFTS